MGNNGSFGVVENRWRIKHPVVTFFHLLFRTLAIIVSWQSSSSCLWTSGLSRISLDGSWLDRGGGTLSLTRVSLSGYSRELPRGTGQTEQGRDPDILGGTSGQSASLGFPVLCGPVPVQVTLGSVGHHRPSVHWLQLAGIPQMPVR